MTLEEKIYSVLIVSASEKFNESLSSFLPELHYNPVKIVDNISAAKRACNDYNFDYVIINSPLPDDTGIRFAIDVAGSKGTISLLSVRSDLYDDIFNRVVDHGVFTITRPFSQPLISMALDWMASARECLRKLEKKTLTIEEKMEEIRIVNRAKWILISELKMDESEAHKFLEKQSMNRCISRRELAEEIIKTYK
jgi:response regulator NasT